MRKIKGLKVPQDATMVEWANGLGLTSNRFDDYIRNLLSEEKTKVTRLETMARETGLPIYETFSFNLPAQRTELLETSRRLTHGSSWTLALRISDGDSTSVVRRELGLSVKQVNDATKSLPKRRTFVAVISPYKPPVQSGSILIADGRALMEFVFGPHTQISKGRATAHELFWCCYGPLKRTVEYSTKDQTLRGILHSRFQEAIKLLLGCEPRWAAEHTANLYAEFHWHEDIGFRFIECSSSPAWTGSANRAQF